jgi:hypothetical protein
MVFFSPSMQMLRYYLKLGQNPIFSKPPFTYHPFIQRNIVLVTEKASLNKLQRQLSCNLSS